MSSPNEREGNKRSYLALGIALGVAVGSGVGAAIGRPYLAAVGIVLGVIIALLLSRPGREEPLSPPDSSKN